jgi:hypothetical protein
MSLREPSTAASWAMVSEARSRVCTLGISGCTATGVGGWSIGMEEGLRFEVGEDRALE